MNNLKTIYNLVNDHLDIVDKAANDLALQASNTIRSIVTNPKSYNGNVSKDDISLIESIYKNIEDVMLKESEALYTNHCCITSDIVEALFLGDDSSVLGLLRANRPFCDLSSQSRNEIKAILDLSKALSERDYDFQGNALYNFAKTHNLNQRVSIDMVSRKYKGLEQ